MNRKEYDIAIIGGSLAARIAGALLAKQGMRVLFLRQREQTAPAWFHSSLFLEKLLGILGGRSCFVSPVPFQVLSSEARLTIQDGDSLENELRRELGTDAGPTLDCLENLRRQGEAIEALLWENHGIPWPGLKNKTRFHLLCRRFKVRPSDLEAPFASMIEHLSAPAQILLQDLFQGLALKPHSRLTISDAALLWYNATRPENLAEPDFSELLRKRFEQFHGAVDEVDNLATLVHDGHRFTGGNFNNGSSFSASWLLLGDLRWQPLFRTAGQVLRLPSRQQTILETGNLEGQLSPLLREQVIPGGPLPMRMAFKSSSEQTIARIVYSGTADDETINAQLSKVLPFARYDMTCIEQPEEALPDSMSDSQIATGLFTNAGICPGENLIVADHRCVLPELGAAGAAILGWTIARHLGQGDVTL